MVFEDLVRVVVPSTLAHRLARVCALEMDGHRWAASNVSAARQVFDEPDAVAVLGAVRRRLARMCRQRRVGRWSRYRSASMTRS